MLMTLPFMPVIQIVKELLRRLEHDSKSAIEWFENNYMKLNPEKCHFYDIRFQI